MHLEGELGTAEPERAAALFERATEAGSAEAAAALAHLYLTGRGVGQSDRRARELFESAAAHTYGPALSGLAYLHESGRGGLARNDARAQALYREAADAGDPAAQMHVATRLLATPTEANTREALRWLRAAAESGDASANNALAWVLATTSHDTLRDGSAARAAAERAVAAERSASTLDTLAAALAATSDFDAAVRRQEEAIAALTEEEAGLRAEFERRLARYAAGEPWRET
jgi:TPR repeat protein